MMCGRKAICTFVVGIALLAMGAAQASVLGSTVDAQGCGTAIGGSVSGTVTNNCGFSYEQVEALIRERTKPLEDLTIEQRETIAAIRRNLDSNDAQIRAALDSLGEKSVPPELLVPRLVGILLQFKELRSSSAAQPGDDAEITALKSQIQQAVEAGDRTRADDLLARIQTKQDAAQDRLAVERAATRSQRGQVALASLNFREAAKHFADAARTLPCGDDYTPQRITYLDSETSARVEMLVSEHLGVNPKNVTSHALLVDDLGADDLDLVELTMALEEEFQIQISGEASERFKSVGDMIGYLKRWNRDHADVAGCP